MPENSNTLRIDVPVRLDQLKVVFSVASPSFEGDLPTSLLHLALIVNDAEEWKAEAAIVAVFHTNAGHLVLDNGAYNKERHVATGNPYKKLLIDLIDRGVQIELCGATARAHGWLNTDTITGIKVNTDAMSRTVQLVQSGYVKITES